MEGTEAELVCGRGRFPGEIAPVCGAVWCGTRRRGNIGWIGFVWTVQHKIPRFRHNRNRGMEQWRPLTYQLWLSAVEKGEGLGLLLLVLCCGKGQRALGNCI